MYKIGPRTLVAIWCVISTVTMSSYYENYKEEYLLDEAASKTQSEVMALLIENSITNWNGSEENNRVFIRLIDDYYVRQLFGNFLQTASCCRKSSS
jgi:hypothetical protein